MMTNQPTKRFHLGWILYPVAFLLLIWILYTATVRELARTPIRDAAAELGQYGFITIRFSTDPFPPLPTGGVRLTFQPMDSLQRMVEMDEITYEYGPAGSEQAAGSGVAQLLPGESGIYTGNAQFSYVGNWWVKVRVTKDGNQADVRFSVYVEPAQ